MKKLFLRLAGYAAVLGVASCSAGLLLGGRPTNLHLEKENGHLALHYSENGQNEHFLESIGEFLPTRPDTTAQANTATQLDNSNAAGSSAPAGQSEWLTVTPAAAPTELDLEIEGGTVTLQAGDAWQLAVRGTDAFTAVMDKGTWEIDSRMLHTDQDIAFILTYPAGTVFNELDLAIGMGELTADGLHCLEADLSVGAGRMTLTGFTAENSCDMQVGMGILDVTGSLNRGTDIECGMGVVRCTLTRPAEYGYEVEEAAGTVEIDGQHYSGLATEVVHNPRAAVQYDIECGMGTVKVLFA